MSDRSHRQPGPLAGRLRVSLIHTVGEVVAYDRSEESVVRELAGRLGTLLAPWSVVIQTARPDDPQLVTAEASADWAGPIPTALGLTFAEAEELELDEAFYAPLSGVKPLGKGAAVAVRAVLCGPGLTGVVSMEHPKAEAGAEGSEGEGLHLARALAESLSGALVGHRSYRHRMKRQTLAEAAFRQGEALLCVVDRSEQVVLFNRALERLTGYAESDVLGKRFSEWLSQGGDERLTKVILETLGGRPSRAFEASLPLKTGGSATALITAAAVADDDHAIQGVALLGLGQHHLTDFSNRQKARMARLRRVAAGVSLKLMQPASGLAMQLSALREALPGDKVEAAGPLAELERLRQALLHLASELGVLSGTRDEPVSSIAVNQIVETALKDTAELLSEHGVRVRTALAGELPDILGLPGRLERAVANLLVNACQAGTQRITARTWDNRDGTIGISVADSGEGIAEEHLAHVLQPFYTARPDGQSIGLGLAVVQDAVDEHDGTVDIDSGEGEGTVVTLTLPVRRSGRRPDHQLESADEA